MSGSDEKQYYLPTEYGIEVYRTTQNMIAIKQEDTAVNEEAIVIVSPARVDQLIRFLRLVKDEILTDQADEAEARSTELPPLSNG